MDRNDLTPLEVFLHMNEKANGEFVNERLRQSRDKYNVIVDEKYGPDWMTHPTFDAKAWIQATNGPRKCTVYSSVIASAGIRAQKKSMMLHGRGHGGRGNRGGRDVSMSLEMIKT